MLNLVMPRLQAGSESGEKNRYTVPAVDVRQRQTDFDNLVWLNTTLIPRPWTPVAAEEQTAQTKVSEKTA